VEDLNTANLSRAEYLAHIERQQVSGLSIRQYCEQNNLIGHRFSYYKGYKLRSKKTEVKKLKSFAKVEIKRRYISSSEFILTLSVPH